MNDTKGKEQRTAAPEPVPENKIWHVTRIEVGHAAKAGASVEALESTLNFLEKAGHEIVHFFTRLDMVHVISRLDPPWRGARPRPSEEQQQHEAGQQQGGAAGAGDDGATK